MHRPKLNLGHNSRAIIKPWWYLKSNLKTITNRTHELFVPNCWCLELSPIWLSLLLPHYGSFQCPPCFALPPWLSYSNSNKPSSPLSQALRTHCCSMPGVWCPGPWPARAPPWGLSFIVPSQGDVPDAQCSVGVFYFSPSLCITQFEITCLLVCMFFFFLD